MVARVSTSSATPTATNRDMPEVSGSTPVKRACDACHRRKVKCIGDAGPPCKNCSQANLRCTYNAVPQKKGPKGSRAKVISELRETQRQATVVAPKVEEGFDIANPPTPATFLRRPNLLPTELINSSVDYFFENVYPTQPILGRAMVQQLVSEMHHNIESYCLVVSLCAYMLIQPNMRLPGTMKFELGSGSDPSATAELGATLLAEAVEARRACNYYENPCHVSVTTSFFFFGCYFCLEKHNTAYFHLREATTLALLMGMNQEATYAAGDVVESAFTRRLFWLLFVTERACALIMQRPLTLHSTIALPEAVQDPNEAAKLMGFNHLVALYKPFDDTFVSLWNQSITGATTGWIIDLQKQLTAALPQYLRSTETQAVDLKISQQWLRVMIWQLSISNRLLSSTSHDHAMTFRYPVDLAHELVSGASQFSIQAMEVHGIGFIKKLFDVACTLIDVMAFVPIEPQGFELGPRDYLQQFLHLIGQLRGGRSRYLPLLLHKANEVLPGITAHMLIPSMTSSTISDDCEEEIDGLDGIHGQAEAGDGADGVDGIDGIGDMSGGIHNGLHDGMPDGLTDGMVDGLYNRIHEGMNERMREGIRIHEGMQDGMHNIMHGNMHDGIHDGMMSHVSRRYSTVSHVSHVNQHMHQQVQPRRYSAVASMHGMHGHSHMDGINGDDATISAPNSAIHTTFPGSMAPSNHRPEYLDLIGTPPYAGATGLSPFSQHAGAYPG